MEIRSLKQHTPTQQNRNDQAAIKNKEEKAEKAVTEQQDQYVPAANEKKATYEKPKVDTATIARLKEESERTYSQLRKMVEELLRSQGKAFQDLHFGTDVEVDEATRAEAQSLIGDGGDLSPEKVSDRIVEFAIAISGGDKGKFELLKGAIEEGFQQAKAALGGELPEISQKTYELVMTKLNKWYEEE